MSSLPPRPTFKQDFTRAKALQPVDVSRPLYNSTMDTKQKEQSPPPDPSHPLSDGHAPILNLPVELLEQIFSYALAAPQPLNYSQTYNRPRITKAKKAGNHALANDQAAQHLASWILAPLHNTSVCRDYCTIAQNIYFKTRTFTFLSANLHPLLLRKAVAWLRPRLETVTSVKLPLHPNKNATLRLEELHHCFPNLSTLVLTEMSPAHFRPPTISNRRPMPRGPFTTEHFEKVPWAGVILQFEHLRALDLKPVGGVSPPPVEGGFLSQITVEWMWKYDSLDLEGFRVWLRGKVGEKWGLQCRGVEGGIGAEQSGGEVVAKGPQMDAGGCDLRRNEKFEKAARERAQWARQSADGPRGPVLGDVLDKRQQQRFT